MKKRYGLLVTFILVFIGCKTKSKQTPIAVSNNSKIIVDDNLNFSAGDVLLSKIYFIKSIDKSCARVSGIISDNKEQRNQFKNNCNFFKLKYNYDEYRGLEKREKLYSMDNVNYYLDLNSQQSDSDDYKFVSLYSFYDGKKIDSIIVYSYENYIEALVEKGRYFYIHDKQIYVYEFNEDEEGIHSDRWSKFSIVNGEFKLDEAISNF